ncbi:MAG: HAD-IIA family hydrolase [Candidatus Didemnitutus sp.]|nr:HAD-IIA family hydrolase [Candidatus Didemnitutus sp.]
MSSPSSMLAGVRHVVLDMDGTLYRGGTLFPFTRPFLAQLRPLGIGYTFLTNNSSRSSADYLAHLARLDIATDPAQLHTSANATVDWLRAHRPGVRRLFALCTPSLAAELRAAGYELTADDPADAPDAVLVAFDTTLDYARLCRTAHWIAHGLPYFATHPDHICPTDEPTVLVDCGSICAALGKATGRAPDRVFGKPDPEMLTGIRRRHQLAAREIAMVGDRIYTDMAMARAAGCVSVLVLSGEATADDARRAGTAPDFVLTDIGELGLLLQASRSGD